MRHAASRKLDAYWDALCGGRPPPGRDVIDPTAIRDVLASVFVLGVAAIPRSRPADVGFHRSGTRIDALLGRALRGTTFDRIWAPRASALAAVLDGRAPVTAVVRGGLPGRDVAERHP